MVGEWLDADTWNAALNPELPAGVFELQDRDGNWWRYPITEFEVESNG